MKHTDFQEDPSRVEILKEYAKKRKESVWQPFFHLLDRTDMFIVHQVGLVTLTRQLNQLQRLYQGKTKFIRSPVIVWLTVWDTCQF